MNRNKCVEENPAISVVMAVYNEPLPWVDAAIKSILDQSLTDFEFIIINDNPLNEDSKKNLKNWCKKDDRIMPLLNDNNIGLAASLNKGIDIARGRYIARMDADDISLPNRLLRQYNYMEKHKDTVVCGTLIEWFGAVECNKIKWIRVANSNELKNQLFIMPCFAHPTVFIRKSSLENAGVKYDENLTSAQDYKLWCDLSFSGLYHNLPEVLLKYRVSSRQISKLNKKDQSMIAREIRINYINNFLYNLPIFARLDPGCSFNGKTLRYLINIENSVRAQYSDSYTRAVRESFAIIIESWIVNSDYVGITDMLVLIKKGYLFRITKPFLLLSISLKRTIKYKYYGK
jgi:glycosyltransferase involved in cell wall biosynthesis